MTQLTLCVLGVAFVAFTLIVVVHSDQFKFEEGYKQCQLYQLQHSKNCPIYDQ